jgi:hypothetical protein
VPVDLRHAPRRTLYLWAMIRRYGATARQKVIIKDLSRTGFRIRSSADYDLGDLIFLEFERGIEAEAWIVRQHDTLPDYGCQFRNPLSQGDVDRVAASGISGEFLHDAA